LPVAGAEAATAEAVAVSTEAVSVVAVFMAVGSTGEASAVALSTVVVFVGNVSAVAVSTAVAFVVTVLVITDSLMMSSSAASVFRGGGAIHTDITVTTITRTIPMDTAGTHTAPMDTADTVTMVGPVTDTAIAADQGMSGVPGVGDNPGYGSLKIREEATCESSKSGRPMFGDKFGE
jgi:hypothetical protein